MKFCTFHLFISCSFVVIFVFQGFASSAEIAHMESQKKPQDRRSFLLGAMSKVKSLPMNEKVKIADALDISVREVPTVGFVSRKAFLRDVGYQGSVVYKGETVIADINGQETVLLINNFFSVRCEQTEHAMLLAFGPSYPPLPAEDGSQARDFWSGFIKVVFFKVREVCPNLFLDLGSPSKYHKFFSQYFPIFWKIMSQIQINLGKIEWC